MALRPPVQRTGENGEPRWNTRDVEAPGRLLHQKLVAARLGRRQEEAVRSIGKSLLAPKDPDQLFNAIVVRPNVIVRDRPVVAEAIGRFVSEVTRAEAQRNAAPVVRPSANHARAPPAEFVPLGDSVRLPRPVPAPHAPLKLPQGPSFRGPPDARRR